MKFHLYYLLWKNQVKIYKDPIDSPGEYDYIKNLKPSGRGELEITDVNNHYINAGLMTYSILDGWWTDAGTPDSYKIANELAFRTNL